MRMMRVFAALIAILVMMAGARAQIVPAPPPVPPIAPPPSAPPPPKIEVPQVPKLDQPPPKPQAAQPSRTSFHDRVVRCLDDDVATRLAPGDRAAYSRACANGQD